jgi:hypothetical protein
LEKFPELRILNLNSNPRTCNCDIVEVMQLAELRRERQPAHKPVRCWDGQHYKTLWTIAEGNRSCNESKTTDPIVEGEREFATDMKVDLTPVSVDVPLSPETSPQTPRFIENTVQNKA